MTELDRVSVIFGDRSVFKEFSYRFPDGVTTAIMGASGCGKTTLLRLLSGLLQPQSGRVTAPSRIAFQFQEPRLCPWLNAAENVNLVLKDKKETLGIAKQLLCDTGLGDDLDKYPSELSGGMQRRVALARTVAASLSSDLVLLDEPFTGLDVETKQRMTDFLRLYTVGKTTVLVTHDETEAKTLAKQTLLLGQVGHAENDQRSIVL